MALGYFRESLREGTDLLQIRPSPDILVQAELTAEKPVIMQKCGKPVILWKFRISEPIRSKTKLLCNRLMDG